VIPKLVETFRKEIVSAKDKKQTESAYNKVEEFLEYIWKHPMLPPLEKLDLIWAYVMRPIQLGIERRPKFDGTKHGTTFYQAMWKKYTPPEFIPRGFYHPWNTRGVAREYE
jgi:hypothetical protein